MCWLLRATYQTHIFLRQEMKCVPIITVRTTNLNVFPAMNNKPFCVFENKLRQSFLLLCFASTDGTNQEIIEQKQFFPECRKHLPELGAIFMSYCSRLRNEHRNENIFVFFASSCALLIAPQIYMLFNWLSWHTYILFKSRNFSIANILPRVRAKQARCRLSLIHASCLRCECVHLIERK